MAEEATGATSEGEDFSGELDAQREKALSDFVKLAEEAFRKKLVTKESGPDEIVYTVRIPHEMSGPGLELFARANTQSH